MPNQPPEVSGPDSDQRSALKRAVVALRAAREQIDAQERARREPIAVVGLGCRFPGGANSPEAFWQLLRSGRDAITEVPPDRWDMDTYYDPTPGTPGKTSTRTGGFIDDATGFDPLFFGISPREAISLDPQQRLLLEVAWEALEHAGIPVEELAHSRTGVFVGLMTNDYAQMQMAGGDLTRIDAYLGTGTGDCFMAGRLSYTLGLQGPCMVIPTACSSSLVAAHLACQSLRSGECDMALAGGVNLMLSPGTFILISSLQAMSQDGRCKTFDAAADGYGRGEGCGVVVLKRLSDAQADGDQILAVIRGSAVNHDGHSAGLTVPNGKAQREVIRAALANADVEPESVSYVEAHGTGTALGDPIEVRALHAVYGEARAADQPLLVGSVKTNIGHLEGAAGAASLIKTVLALQNEEIPPHLHLHNPNPHIAWEQVRVAVTTRLTPWHKGAQPRMAGISAFGMSGTNAHLIIAEAPPKEERPAHIDRPRHLLAISARSAPALQELAASYEDRLARLPDQAPADICYSANAGRSHYSHRLAVSAGSANELREKLSCYRAGSEVAGVSAGQIVANKRPRLVMMFTGQGSQYVGMGRTLYERAPVFRDALDQCAALLAGELERPLLDVLFGAPGATGLLDQTAYTQPALFALEYALATLWQSWGVQPDVLIGHSVGEYVAACLAGVFDLPNGLKLIAARSRLMQRLPAGGAMLSVWANEGFVQGVLAALPPDLRRGLSIAAVNGPESVVVSGDGAAVAAVQDSLERAGRRNVRLTVSHAFHSPLMEPMLVDFELVARGVAFRPARLPVISNVSGRRAGAEEMSRADYWVRHVRAPVRFRDGMLALREEGCELFLEIGPGTTLIGLGRQNLPEDDLGWLTSLRRGHDDWETMLDSLGNAYARGVPVDWPGFDRPYPRRRLSVPTYPFQRQRYWLAPAGSSGTAGAGAGLSARSRDDMKGGALLGRQLRSALQDHVYEAQLGEGTPAYLADHQVFGRVVLPGAACLEMALSAGAAQWKGRSLAVEEVVFQQALVIPPGGQRIVQTLLRPDSAGQAGFQVYSRDGAEERPGDDGDGEDEWTLHAAGRLRPLETPSPATDSLESARRRCTEPAAVAGAYERLQALGLQYGPAFQGVRSAWRGAGEAVGQVQLPEPVRATAGGYHLHPALLDACMQLSSLASTDRAALDSEGNDLYLPIGVDGLRFYAADRPDGYEQLWVHAAVRAGQEARSGMRSVDMTLWDDAGRLVAEIEGLHARRASPASFRGADARRLNDLFYEVAWQPRPLVEAAGDMSPAGPWLLFVDDLELGRSLGNRLDARGGESRIITVGPSLEQVDEAYWRVDPFDESALESLLARPAAGDAGWRGIVYAWGATNLTLATTPEQLLARQRESCGALLRLLQQLPLGSRPGLWLVTHGCQPAADSMSPGAVGQAPLWGLGKVIALEHPELNCRLVDLDPQRALAEQVDVLAREIAAADGSEGQVAYRNDLRYVPRLHKLALAPPTESGGPRRLRFSRRGMLDNLELEAFDRQPPGPGQVEIEVRAAGLNFRDVLNVLGMYPGEAGPPGVECAGVVAAVGPGVRDFAVGEAVIALAPACFGDYVVTGAELVARKPESLSWEESAGIPVAFLTADQCLRRLANVQPGERVLIHSATGGVGLVAVQVAQAMGAEVFATAGSPEKRAYLRELGINHVFDSRSVDFGEQIRGATGEDGGAEDGVDVVLNALTGEAIRVGMELLRPGGRFLEIGKAEILTPEQAAAINPGARYLTFALDELIMTDRAEVGRMLREMAADFSDGKYRPLPVKVFEQPETRQAFRFMAQARHIGKIVVRQQAATRLSERAISPEKSYLITGGLGGLGLAVADWLVEQGARSLAVLGRGPGDEAAQEHVKSLRRRGARVEVYQADVADFGRLAAVMDHIQRELPALGGVIHAAGVLDDGVLVKQDWPRFERVLAPKVAGAWNLHRLTADLPLDHFVLFSSSASVLGSSGQGSYTAGNSFLDALAHERRMHGLPAVSINWGPWDEVGMAAGLDSRQRQRMDAVMQPLSPETATQALERILQGQAARTPTAQVAVMDANWAQIAGRSPFFEALLEKSAAELPAPPERGQLLAELLPLSPPKRRERLLSFLRGQAVRILGLDAAFLLDPGQPLNELGLDSLMAVEMRNALGALLDRTLPTTVLFDYPTLAALTDFLVGELPPAESAVGRDDAIAEPDDGALSEEEVRQLEEIRQLNDEEAAAAIARELEALAEWD